MKNFVEASWLIDNLKDVVVVDVRYDLHNKEYGKTSYTEEHIPGAYYLDVDRDLAGTKETHGGSRPVPEAEVFVKKIEAMGIDNNTSVVLYDENMITASRAFWMFKYIGHRDVRIVNGGYKAWLEAGGEVTAEIPAGKASIYKAQVSKEIYSSIERVKENIEEKGSVLIECRSHDRYLGNNEPFYSRAGHIPSAICIDSKSLLTEGKLKPVEELKEIMGRVTEYEDVTFYCGSGINAALDYVVYDELGGESRIYIGGFSDWISYDENHVEVVDENQ